MGWLKKFNGQKDIIFIKNGYLPSRKGNILVKMNQTKNLNSRTALDLS